MYSWLNSMHRESTMQEIPLTIDALNTSCVATGDSFTLDRIHEPIDVKGRRYVLIKGTYERSFEGMRNVYAIVTPDTVVAKWRFVHMTQTMNNVGFFFLANQSRIPQFASRQTHDPHVIIQLSCQEERTFVRRNVLDPYTVPLTRGTEIDGRRVQVIGDPLYHGDNKSAIVPVQFDDERHGIVRCYFTQAQIMPMRNDAAAQLLSNSTHMPSIRSGMGSSVWHIRVDDHGDKALIKSHFNEKSDRGDVVLRS